MVKRLVKKIKISFTNKTILTNLLKFFTGIYTRIMALKETKPELKILLAVGGWNVGSGNFMKFNPINN